MRRPDPSTHPILTVDVGAFEQADRNARRATVDGVRRSLETGFVYARHDVASAQLDAAYDVLGRFFALPSATKARCAVPGSQGQTGYTGLLVETAAGADRPDLKEMLNWGVVLPALHPLRRAHPHSYMERVFPEQEVPGMSEVLGALHESLFDLQRRFLRVVALGLGCAETFFDEMLTDGPTLTRAIHYPPMSQAPAEGFQWAGAHGDINLVTALPRATSRGLQVEVEGQWIDAVAPDDCAILNTGLMMERLTNGVIPAGWHRVVAAPGQTGARLSVVQFCHPTPRTVLVPLPSCIDEQRPLRYAAVSAGEWLDQVLYDINLTTESVEGASPRDETT